MVSIWTPGVTKLSPKDPESAKNQQHVIQGTRNGAPGATLELKVPTNAKHTHTQKTTHPNSKKNTPEGAPRSQTKKKNHMTTNSQPTNQRKRDTKKQAIEQTHTHTHTRKRASNCKHKLKLPRPGARRRRRRSGRGFSERTL